MENPEQTQKTLVVLMLYLCGCVFGCLLGCRSTAQLPTSRAAVALTAIDQLDACIQQRFATVDNQRFGMQRINPFNPHLASQTLFLAENEAERRAVQRLADEQMHVEFYLAGRGSQRSSGEQSPTKPLSKVMTIAAQSDQLPPLRTLWLMPVIITSPGKASARPWQEVIKGFQDENGQSILAKVETALATSDRYEYEKNGMQYSLRPIRAQQPCLSCHNQVSLLTDQMTKQTDDRRAGKQFAVGDALGAAIYVYWKHKGAQ